MQIGGLQKFSLLDYPQKLAAVIFTQGCTFRCHFCHNPSLVLKEEFTKPLLEKEIFSFLEKRKNQLEAVVISGGEPTLQKDLISFIEKIKSMHYLVKLDTTGISPEVLKELLQKGLLNYVAMDIKAPLEKYSSIIAAPFETAKIEASIALLMQSPIDFEFRTTLVPALHTLEDIVTMAKMVKGAPLYVLQTFKSTHVLNSSLQGQKAYTKEEIEPFRKQALNFVKQCEVR